ncbi:hypothetical protein C4A76_18330 [Brevibacillus laterosporus]|uniref:hypothetical protein n=1 Tax=Brevibacillus laterosporus TaxID=1465 RepID=UPI000CE46757|nr:hypothetical protein [Brevibacillus laterosporus]PPA84192.1 hypothetical protein C4A76_18330 [Brevibacillus laterosporus]
MLKSKMLTAAMLLTTAVIAVSPVSAETTFKVQSSPSSLVAKDGYEVWVKKYFSRKDYKTAADVPTDSFRHCESDGYCGTVNWRHTTVHDKNTWVAHYYGFVYDK